MKVLLVQNATEEIRERITFAIESAFRARVREALDLPTALSLFSQNDFSTDLIVFDSEVNTEVGMDDFIAAAEKIPLILISEGGLKWEFTDRLKVVGQIDSSKIPGQLVPRIEELVKANELSREDSDFGFIRIRMRLLLSLKTLKGDIFIRLSDRKFVKIFHGGEQFEKDDFEKYTKKNIEYFYIRAEDSTHFIDKYNADLKVLLKGAAVSISSAMTLNEEAQETVQELVLQLGFTQQVQEITKNQVALTMKAIGKSPILSDILKKMQQTPGKYISSHSTMVAYVACGLSAALQWDSDHTFSKLNMAAFLHDITLENHEIAAITSLKELSDKEFKFTPDEVRAYKLHTVRAGELTREFKEIPPDVDTIVFQHHERPDGTGFPRRLNHTKIAPLTAVFIIAHDFVHQSIQSGMKMTVKDFIIANEAQYNAGNFKKIVKIMSEMEQ